MPVPDCAVISAAGLGSRLGLDMPKCMVDVGGKTVIQRQIELLWQIPVLRVVVGFKGDAVVDHVSQVRPDAVFVHNPHFQHTSNAHSLFLGSHDLQSGFLALDGDVVIPDGQLEAFLGLIVPGESLLGVCSTRTEQPVGAQFDPGNGVVSALGARPDLAHEWTGIAYLDGITFNDNDHDNDNAYVFEVLGDHLPLRGAIIECFEIDTPGDLESARKAMSSDQQ